MKSRRIATLRCEDCGALFQRRADAPTRAVDGKLRCTVCSRRARAAGRTCPERKTGDTAACAICGTTFYRKGSRASQRFCSTDCRDEGLRQADRIPVPLTDNAGTKNPGYKHGRRVGKNTGKAKVRAAVIARDGDSCLICGRPPKGLHLHRVRYGSEGGTYVPENCVQLCGDHHALMHSSKRTWQPLLLDYVTTGSPAVLASLQLLAA